MTPLLLAALVGCADLEAALEAPYVLAPGLAGATSLVPIDDHALAVATPSGVVRVAGDGAVSALGPPAEAVSSLPGRLVRLSGETVSWGPLDQPEAATGSVAVPGARDVLGWYDEQLLVLHDRGVQTVQLADGALGPLIPLSAGRALSLSDREGAALVIRDTAVLELSEGALTPLAEGLTAARGAAIDGAGRVWVLHGQPPVLSRLTEGGLVEVARHVGDPLDLHAGTGGLLSPAHLYLADASGSVDYLPLPP